MIDLLHVAALVLAVFRLTEIVTMDRISEPLRRRFPHYLWGCPRCVSVWAGIVCTLVFMSVPWLNWPLALSWLFLVRWDLRGFRSRWLDEQYAARGGPPSRPISGGSDITAANCTQLEVQTRINQAVSGDRVVIPACAATTWNTGISIPSSKIIEVTGAGIGATNIVSNYSSTLISISISNGGAGLTRFGNLSINAGPSSHVVEVNGGTGQGRFRVHHISMTNVAGRGIAVIANGPDFSGLVDHNTIATTGTGAHGVEARGYGEQFACAQPELSSDPCNNGFDTAPTHYFGTGNFVFFEDNTISADDRFGDGAIDAYSGAKFVFRHNTVQNAWIGVHGADSGPYRGIHSFEIYANTFTNSLAAIPRLFYFRSGSGPIYDNTATGLFNGKTLTINRIWDTGGGSGGQNFGGLCSNGTSPWDGNTPGRAGWPCLDQSGWIFGHDRGSARTLTPVYFWNNMQNGSLISIDSDISSNYQASGVEYVNSLARPTGTTDYLATYTAYPYPHPLQGGAPPDTTPPSAPSSLVATTTSSTQINLSWTAATDDVAVTGYHIERCTGAGCASFAEVGTSTGTSFSSTALTPSTSYSYRVRANDAALNLGPYSNTATAVTSASSAATKYVDNSGAPACANTPSNGTEAAPFCTVFYGISQIVGGDTLYVKTGTYNESFRIGADNFPNVAGTAGARTRILAYPGHTPTLRAGTTPGSWSTGGRMKIANTSYLDFEGFTIINGNQGLAVDNDCGPDFGNCSAHHINVRNVTIHDVGQDGLSVRTDLSGASVTTFVHDVLIEGCTVYNTGRLGSSQNGEGMYVGTSAGGADTTNTVTIRGCAVHDTQDEMIELKGGTHDVIVENCTLSGAMTGSTFSNGGGVLEMDTPDAYLSRPAHIIRNNIFRDLTAPGASGVIRAGAGSDIYNNIIYNAGSLPGITSNTDFCNSNCATGGAQIRRIYHNTIDRASGIAVVVTDGTNVDSRNNLGPTGTNNLAISSTYFVSYAGHNYRLLTGVAPIGGGADLTATVATDYDGATRVVPVDIGAFEFAGTPPPPADDELTVVGRRMISEPV